MRLRVCACPFLGICGVHFPRLSTRVCACLRVLCFAPVLPPNGARMAASPLVWSAHGSGHLHCAHQPIHISWRVRLILRLCPPPRPLQLRQGWDGEGLGAAAQGQREPVKAVVKNDRRGIGDGKGRPNGGGVGPGSGPNRARVAAGHAGQPQQHVGVASVPVKRATLLGQRRLDTKIRDMLDGPVYPSETDR